MVDIMFQNICIGQTHRQIVLFCKSSMNTITSLKVKLSSPSKSVSSAKLQVSFSSFLGLLWHYIFVYLLPTVFSISLKSQLHSSVLLSLGNPLASSFKYSYASSPQCLKCSNTKGTTFVHFSPVDIVCFSHVVLFLFLICLNSTAQPCFLACLQTDRQTDSYRLVLANEDAGRSLTGGGKENPYFSHVFRRSILKR